MIKKLAGIILIAFVFGVQSAGAVAGATGTGKAGWTIFNKAREANARGISSLSADYSNLPGIFYNPAITAKKSQHEIFFMSEQGFVEDKLGGILVGLPTGSGMFTAGAVYYDAGPVELNWMNNGTVATETVSLQQDLMAVLSYARNFDDKVLLGASVKGASSRVVERKTAMAYAADLGIAFMPTSRLTLSLAGQNLGTSSVFESKADPLPVAGHAAVTYFCEKASFYLISGAGATYRVNDQKLTPEAGIELGIGMLALNASYRFDADNPLVIIGLDLTVGAVEFGYSYVPDMFMGALQRLNIGYRFSTAASPVKTAAKPKQYRSLKTTTRSTLYQNPNRPWYY